MTYSDQPIGELGSVAGWKQLPINECGERLVPIGPYSKYPQIATDSIYAGMSNSSPYTVGKGKLHNTLFTVFIRESVAERLAKAASLLPPQHMLLVWDAYRPLRVQRALFDYYVDVLENRGLIHDQAVVEAQRFVSIPCDDLLKPPPHNTGGAVDLTIIHFPDAQVWKSMQRLEEIGRDAEAAVESGDESGFGTPAWDFMCSCTETRQMKIRMLSAPLQMGTTFDAVEPETATRFYEKLRPELLGEKERQRLVNRRLLYGVMTEAGLSNYPEEWWHYDFGNQFDAARTGRQAIYGSAELSAENRLFEKLSIVAHHAYLNHGEIAEVKTDGSFRVNEFSLLPGGFPANTVHPLAAAL